MGVLGVKWREIVEWMVGRLASSFNSIFNGLMPTLPIGKGHSAHGFSVLSLNSSRATFPQGYRPGPSSVRIWVRMCWCVFGGDKRSHKKLMSWLRKLARQGRKEKWRNKRKLGGRRDLTGAGPSEPGLLVLLRKVDLDEKIQCSPSDAKCNFVLIPRTLSWAIGNTLQLRAAKEGGLDQESAKGWNNAMCVGVCLWHLC